MTVLYVTVVSLVTLINIPFYRFTVLPFFYHHGANNIVGVHFDALKGLVEDLNLNLSFYCRVWLIKGDWMEVQLNF